MEQLEQDLQEGVQYMCTAISTSDKEPWRRGITDRNTIRDTIRANLSSMACYKQNVMV